jgi:hypothetical protein
LLGSQNSHQQRLKHLKDKQYTDNHYPQPQDRDVEQRIAAFLQAQNAQENNARVEYLNDAPLIIVAH